MSKKRKKQSELGDVVKSVEETLDKIEDQSEKVMKPMRRSLLRRFPVGFVLVVAFGASATATAGTMLFMRVPFFVEKPSILLLIGLGTLILTGKLHQKLG